MQEVSGRAVAALLGVLDDAGVSTDRLLSGMPRAKRPDGSRRVDWDVYALILDRAVQELGGLSEFEDLMGNGKYRVAAVKRLAALCLNPVDLYRLIHQVLAPSLFTHIACTFTPVDTRHVELTMTIPRHYRGSLAFHHGTLALERTLPRWIGLPDARVEASFDMHRGTFRVELPSSRTFVARLRDVRRRPEVAALIEEFEERNTQLQALFSARPPVQDRPVQNDGADASLVAVLGPRLLEARSAEELAGAVLEAVHLHADATHVSLWVTDPGTGARRRIAHRGDDGGAAHHALPLVVSGEHLGELRVGRRSRDGTPVRVLEALVPWVSIALERTLGIQGSMLASLEAIPLPVFLVGLDGTVAFATSTARRAMQERAALGMMLRDAGRGSAVHPDLRVLGPADRPLERYRLVIMGAEKDDQFRRIDERAREWNLTSRKATVLRHVVAGLSNKEIASLLGIGEATVEAHVSDILKKARVTGRTALMALVYGPRP